MDVKRISDPRIKIPGVRINRSSVMMMKTVAKEKDMPVSALYNEIVKEFLLKNSPPQKP